MNSSKRNRVASGFMWRLMERMGAQVVSFVVSIVLARILDPDVYGTIALIVVFTTIMQVFVDSGLGNALIQKKHADNLDFSTVFYFNIAFCLVLYGLMWVASPSIAEFYHDPSLVPYIRALSLTIVISGIKNVQQAYVSRNMLFKKFFFSTLCGTIGAAIVGIIMALRSYGIWALIAQQLFNMLVDTAVLWITVPWRPTLAFSFQRLGGLLSYGWKLLASSLLDTGYNSLRQLLIGRIYTRADLAYYNQGDKFPALIINNINASIDSVLLPAMSEDQDDKSRVRDMMRRSIMVSTYLMSPLLIGMAACADTIVRLILTDKWLPCVPYMQIFCLTYLSYPIHTANLNAIKAMGRSDIFLKLEIIKKGLGLIVLLVFVRVGVMELALSLLFFSILSMGINAWPNKQLLSYSIRDQVFDILTNLTLALVMGAIVWAESALAIPMALKLALQVITGVVVYAALSLVMKNSTFTYLLDILKTSRKKA